MIDTETILGNSSNFAQGIVNLGDKGTFNYSTNNTNESDFEDIEILTGPKMHPGDKELLKMFGLYDRSVKLTIEEDIQKAADVLSSHPLSDRFDFIRSEKTIYEILPKGIGKGRSIEKLTEHLGLDSRKTVAVGDYDNDISMIRAAGVGIAVSNASQNTLTAADYITVSNEEHAIARVISDIEEGNYNI